MRAIAISAHGGPEVLQLQDLPEPEAGPSDVVVEVAAAGLNYIDTYQRSGLYPMKLPYVPGLEGAGRVTAVGAQVSGIGIGDRVAWAGAPGAYATLAKVPAAMAVQVPDMVGLDVAAAVMLQGLTAHFLATDCYSLQPGDRCLVHAGAGGVGLLLIQIAKRRGAEVFTTVGSADKAELTRAAGADHTILYRDTDFVAAVEAIAGQKPLAVVYDGVGKETFEPSLNLLRRRGLMATFGNASGPVDPVLPLRLSQGGSLYLTRPTMGDYTATREELEARCNDLFAWISDGTLDVRIGHRFPLEEAADAHRLIESRNSTGKILLEA